jgi:hypothetical protein
MIVSKRDALAIAEAQADADGGKLYASLTHSRYKGKNIRYFLLSMSEPQKNLGGFRTKKEAHDREKAIQFFKRNPEQPIYDPETKQIYGEVTPEGQSISARTPLFEFAMVKIEETGRGWESLTPNIPKRLYDARDYEGFRQWLRRGRKKPVISRMADPKPRVKEERRSRKEFAPPDLSRRASVTIRDFEELKAWVTAFYTDWLDSHGLSLHFTHGSIIPATLGAGPLGPPTPIAGWEDIERALEEWGQEMAHSIQEQPNRHWRAPIIYTMGLDLIRKMSGDPPHYGRASILWAAKESNSFAQPYWLVADPRKKSHPSRPAAWRRSKRSMKPSSIIASRWFKNARALDDGTFRAQVISEDYTFGPGGAPFSASAPKQDAAIQSVEFGTGLYIPLKLQWMRIHKKPKPKVKGKVKGAQSLRQKRQKAWLVMTKRPKGNPKSFGDSEHDWDEVLIQKGGKRFTRKQIRDYYTRNLNKIWPYIEGQTVLVYIGTGKNESVLRRKAPDGSYIKITKKKGLDDPRSFEYWINRRAIEFHPVLTTKTSPIAWVDIDIHAGNKAQHRRLRTKASKAIPKIKMMLRREFGLSPIKVYESGRGDGFHVEGQLPRRRAVDALRKKLKKELDALFEDDEVFTTGLAKNGQIRLDVTTLKTTGSLRAPYSMSVLGGVKKPKK